MTTHQLPLPITLFVLDIEAIPLLRAGRARALHSSYGGRRRYG